MMIIDIGAPYSLVGKEWMRKYLDEQKMEIDDLEKVWYSKRFRFGPGKIYQAETRYKIPFLVKSEDDTEVVLEADVYEVDASVPLLCGKDSLENWNVNIDLRERILGIKMQFDKKGENIRVKMEETKGEHYALKVAIHQELDDEKTVLLLENMDDVTSYKKIKKSTPVNKS